MSLCQEIIDQIIDNLESHSSFLKVCSLISHAWFPRSQSILHAQLTIGRSGLGTEKLSFYKKHQHLLGYVKKLRLENVLQKNLQGILGDVAIRNLQSLSLTGLSLRHGRKSGGYFLCKSYSSITSLSLEKVAFDAPYDLISFITSFPRLLDLSLCHSHRRRCEPRLSSKKDDKDNSVDPPLTDLPIPLNLRHLTVDLTEGSTHFARYLCDMHHALSLTSLDIILNENRDNVSEILIPTVKDTVTRLCQSDNSKFKPDNICGPTLFHFTQLTNVILTETVDWGHNKKLTWIEDTIIKLNYDSLEEMVLRLRIAKPWQVTIKNIRRLLGHLPSIDNHVAEQVTLNVKLGRPFVFNVCLPVDFRRTMDISQIIAVIKNLCSRCDKIGVLKFSHWEPDSDDETY